MYTQHFSRMYPGLFVILLDQSGSMAEPVDGKNCSKADFATTELNSVIHEMINYAQFDEKGVRKKYAYLSIFGYGQDVQPLLSPVCPGNRGEPIDIPYLAEHPLGSVPVIRQVRSTITGTIREDSVILPAWITPDARGRTEMARAFECAQRVVRDWLNGKPEPGQAERRRCFPPIIINLTDGNHTGDGDPLLVAREIQQNATLEGNVLIFNCHFTTSMSQPCIFPASIDELRYLDNEHFQIASQMFEMSSIIPDVWREDAGNIMRGKVLPRGARCFVYNANPDILIKFLRWGTLRKISQTSATGGV